jgi:hypothetical protein
LAKGIDASEIAGHDPQCLRNFLLKPLHVLMPVFCQLNRENRRDFWWIAKG